MLPLPFALQLPCAVLELAMYLMATVAACQRPDIDCGSACAAHMDHMAWDVGQTLAVLAACYATEWHQRRRFARQVSAT